MVGEHFVGDNVILTCTDPRDGAWYVVLGHGHFGMKLHRSDDRGATWTEIGVPEYPPKPEGFVDISCWGNERDWALANIWSIEPTMQVVEQEEGEGTKTNFLVGGLAIGAAVASLPLFLAFSKLFPDPSQF